MWLKDNPGQQWDPLTPAYSLHILYNERTEKLIWVKPCGYDPPRVDGEQAGEWGCKSWAKAQGISNKPDPEDYFKKNPIKEVNIAPQHTRGVDTLWCPADDGRTTEEQVGLRLPEGSPNQQAMEDAEMLFNDAQMDLDNEYPF